MAPRARKPAPPKKRSTLHNYLVPHAGNEYHPKLFRTAAVSVLLIGIVFFEGAYLLDTKLAQNHTSFLASVLPAALLDLTNADREANNIAPLTRDAALDRAAQLKANDMAEKGYFAHTSPEGRSPWYWLDQVNYAYTFAGENLAINFDDSSAVEEAWMNSPTHRANIVKPQYTRVGYAVAQGTYEGKETTFVVQEFAATPSDATVTTQPEQKNPVTKVVDKVIASVKPPEQPEPVIQPSETSGESVPDTAAAGSSDVASSAEPVVLGTQESPSVTHDSVIGTFFKKVVASPQRSSIYIFGGLAGIITILLILALFAHARVRYVEVLAGGLIIIVFALSALFYNVAHSLTPVVPETGTASLEAGAAS